jgi:hypothetical protein
MLSQMEQNIIRVLKDLLADIEGDRLQSIIV